MCGTTAGTATAGSWTCACSGCERRSAPSGSRRSAASATSSSADMTSPFASLRWKITALVAAACCVVALVIGVLVHTVTYERSIAEGEAKALARLADALRQDPGSPDPAITNPDELPRALRDRVRR